MFLHNCDNLVTSLTTLQNILYNNYSRSFLRGIIFAGPVISDFVWENFTHAVVTYMLLVGVDI